MTGKWKRQPDRSYYNSDLRALIHKGGPIVGNRSTYCVRIMNSRYSSCGHKTLKAAKSAAERISR